MGPVPYQLRVGLPRKVSSPDTDEAGYGFPNEFGSTQPTNGARVVAVAKPVVVAMLAETVVAISAVAAGGPSVDRALPTKAAAETPRVINPLIAQTRRARREGIERAAITLPNAHRPREHIL